MIMPCKSESRNRKSIIPPKVCPTDFEAFFYQVNTVDTYSRVLYL